MSWILVTILTKSQRDFLGAGCGHPKNDFTGKTAHAQRMDDYKEALKDFQSSQLFKKNEKLSRWFSNTWLPEVEVCTVSTEVGINSA